MSPSDPTQTSRLRRSLRLEVGELYHLPPLCRFGGDEGIEFGRRTRKCRTAQIDQAGFDLCIGKAGINLVVESLNDCRGRMGRCTEADPLARLETRHDRAHGQNVRSEISGSAAVSAARCKNLRRKSF